MTHLLCTKWYCVDPNHVCKCHDAICPLVYCKYKHKEHHNCVCVNNEGCLAHEHKCICPLYNCKAPKHNCTCERMIFNRQKHPIFDINYDTPCKSAKHYCICSHVVSAKAETTEMNEIICQGSHNCICRKDPLNCRASEALHKCICELLGTQVCKAEGEHICTCDQDSGLCRAYYNYHTCICDENPYNCRNTKTHECICSHVFSDKAKSCEIAKYVYDEDVIGAYAAGCSGINLCKSRDHKCVNNNFCRCGNCNSCICNFYPGLCKFIDPGDSHFCICSGKEFPKRNPHCLVHFSSRS